jgi:hypothetical protein
MPYIHMVYFTKSTMYVWPLENDQPARVITISGHLRARPATQSIPSGFLLWSTHGMYYIHSSQYHLGKYLKFLLRPFPN